MLNSLAKGYIAHALTPLAHKEHMIDYSYTVKEVDLG
jgi:hypothetical protein